MAVVTRSGGIIPPAAAQMMLSTLIRKQGKEFSCNQRRVRRNSIRGFTPYLYS